MGSKSAWAQWAIYQHLVSKRGLAERDAELPVLESRDSKAGFPARGSKQLVENSGRPFALFRQTTPALLILL